MEVWLLIVVAGAYSSRVVVPQLPSRDECMRIGRLTIATGSVNPDDNITCIKYTTAKH